VLVSVDPGHELQRLVARLRGKKSHSPTGGEGFSRQDYRRMFEQASFVVAETGGNSFLSAALITPGVARSNSRWVGGALASLGQRDHQLGGYSRFALHRWIAAKKSGT